MRRIFLLILIALSNGHAGIAAENAAAGARSGTAGSSKYPETTLQSRFLKANLYLPDPQEGYYQGTRFDWSGLISHIEYGSHTFFCEFKQEHDPLNHDDICGTAEEFGIESPPSFSNAKAGEPFIKIGIGILERPDDADYAFWKRYHIRTAGSWKVERSPGKISFRQSLQGPKGWAYDYTKVIETSASSPTLRIARRLKNTGSQMIETDHYDHNFLRIDDVPAGPDYVLEFRFEPRLTADSRTQGYVAIEGKALVFTKTPPPEVGIWVRMEGFSKLEDNEIRIVNRRTGAAMTVTTDQPLSKLVFYSSGGVLCPEAFVRVRVPPGQTYEWTTSYQFTADKL